MSGPPWFAEGLRFSCRRCGACCTGAPGYVWLAEADIRALAAALGLDPPAFVARYARRVDGAWSLREERDGRCVLFEPDCGCRAYGARPAQCRTWPFWPRVVATPASWAREAAECPGMNSGPLVERLEIERLLRTPTAAPWAGIP
jgi:hypothetical protein